MMQAHLRRRWWSRSARDRYTKAVGAVQDAAKAYELDKSDQASRAAKRP